MKERVLILVLLLAAVVVLIISDFGNQPKVYDCRLAEWHPDIPKEVREECRKLKNEINNQLREKNKIYI